MKLRTFTCFVCALWLFTVSSQSSFADRTVTLYRQSLKLTGDRARGVSFRLEVSCENLSSVTQNVKVELLEKSLQTSICSNAANLDGWKKRGNCWFDANINLALSESSVKIPAMSGRDILFQASCVFTPTGLDCDKVYELDKMGNANYKFKSPFLDDGRATCTGVAEPCMRTGLGEFQSRIRATATPDRGAVVCGAFSSLGLPYSGEVPAQLVTPLNAGRPF